MSGKWRLMQPPETQNLFVGMSIFVGKCCGGYVYFLFWRSLGTHQTEENILELNCVIACSLSRGWSLCDSIWLQSNGGRLWIYSDGIVEEALDPMSREVMRWLRVLRVLYATNSPSMSTPMLGLLFLKTTKDGNASCSAKRAVSLDRLQPACVAAVQLN